MGFEDDETPPGPEAAPPKPPASPEAPPPQPPAPAFPAPEVGEPQFTEELAFTEEVTLPSLPREPSEALPADPGVAEPWRMLHPASLLVNLVPKAVQFVRRYWVLFFFVLFRQEEEGSSVLYYESLLGAFLLFGSFGDAVVHWATLRYRVEGDRLFLRSGLLNRQERVFSPSRVQNVEVVQNIFQRGFGLAEVRLETASGDGVEGLLSALSHDEADRLLHVLKPTAPAAEEAGDEPAPVLALDFPDLAVYGATATRWSWVFVALFFVQDLITMFFPTQSVELNQRVGWAGW